MSHRSRCLVARNKYPGVIVNESFIFVTHSLFPVRISKGMKKRLGIGEEVVTCKVYLGLAFTISTLECVTIGCCEVGGGGGGVVGGVGVVCGDAVNRGVGDVN
ncbi:hypothetical protein Tco_0343309 [Tanacetum coccineum]